MSVANHEASRIEFPGGATYNFNGTTYDMRNYNDMSDGRGAPHDNIVGKDIVDIAYQSATITTRTNNPTVAAIGYRGVAAISDLIGSVDVSLEGILLYTPSAAPGNSPTASGYYWQADASASKGLLNATLYDYVSVWGGCKIQTKGADNDDTGKAVCVQGMYLSSIAYNFNQNDNVTTTWNFTAYDCVWDDADPVLTPTTGTGVNFVPLTSKDIDIDVIFPGGTSIDNVQSVQFSAQINREEVFRIGQKTPFDRPVRFPFEVTANLEVLADTAEMLNMYKPDYEWNNASNPSSPNKIEVYVYKKATGLGTGANAKHKICGAPYQRPVDGSLRISVGANSTVTLNTTGWEFEF